MKAGPKLDVLVAEKVMGWTRGPRSGGMERWVDASGKEAGTDVVHGNVETYLADETYLHATPEGAGAGDYYYPDEAWSPSTDIRAAWEVMEKKLVPLGWGLEPIVAGWNVVEIDDYPYDTAIYVKATAATAPLAICLAALAAVGVTDVPE